MFKVRCLSAEALAKADWTFDVHFRPLHSVICLPCVACLSSIALAKEEA